MPYYHFACKVDRQGFGHGLYLRPRERIMLLDSASSGPVRCFARFREALRLRTLGEMHEPTLGSRSVHEGLRIGGCHPGPDDAQSFEEFCTSTS